MYIRTAVTTFIFLLLLLPTISAANASKIEIFDIKQEKVVKTLTNSALIQREVQNCLNTISGLSHSVNPIPDEGIILKVPIEPQVKISNEWLTAFVDEVKLMISPKQKPLLIIYDDDNNPRFFEFEHDPSVLLSKLRE